LLDAVIRDAKNVSVPVTIHHEDHREIYKSSAVAILGLIIIISVIIVTTCSYYLRTDRSEHATLEVIRASHRRYLLPPRRIISLQTPVPSEDTSLELIQHRFGRHDDETSYSAIMMRDLPTSNRGAGELMMPPPGYDDIFGHKDSDVLPPSYNTLDLVIKKF